MTQSISREPDHAISSTSATNSTSKTNVGASTPSSTPTGEAVDERERRNTNGSSGQGKPDARELLQRIAERRARRRERIIAAINKILDTWAEEDAGSKQGEQRRREAGQDSVP